MKRGLLVFLAMLMSSAFVAAAWSATYSYTSPAYEKLENHRASTFTKAM